MMHTILRFMCPKGKKIKVVSTSFGTLVDKFSVQRLLKNKHSGENSMAASIITPYNGINK